MDQSISQKLSGLLFDLIFNNSSPYLIKTQRIQVVVQNGKNEQGKYNKLITHDLSAIHKQFSDQMLDRMIHKKNPD